VNLSTDHHNIHSFPTRRSSDLTTWVPGNILHTQENKHNGMPSTRMQHVLLNILARSNSGRYHRDLHVTYTGGVCAFLASLQRLEKQEKSQIGRASCRE